MKTSVALTLLFLCVALFSRAQNICTGDVTLTTQEEVDAFDCTRIKGTLTITGDGITNIRQFPPGCGTADPSATTC